MAFFAAARFRAVAVVALLLFALAAAARLDLLLFALAVVVRFALLLFALAAAARLALVLLDERDDDALRLAVEHLTRVRLPLLRADRARVALVHRTGTGLGRVQPT